ncbi:cytochrome b [Argonema galeatum]|uniref:cytochrome b n=1 Tax=Argonema galeatum TaxID=2942762 RepID=UPI00201231E4|nr:cytochrome b [Argonema galeatum]MCL1467535.1 cytochrome b [Argonema galeatum A003/A1]
MNVAQIEEKKAKKKTFAQNLWFLHWLMAACFLLLFATGAYMTDLPKKVSYGESLYELHKTLGVVVMSVLLARIVVLLRVIQHKYRRRLPKLTGEWLKTFFFHTSLYFFMLLVPLSGYFCSNSYGYDVVIFGTDITLPDLFPENKEVAEFSKSLHFWLAYTFLAAIALHAIDQWKYLRAQGRRFYTAVNRSTETNK